MRLSGSGLSVVSRAALAVWQTVTSQLVGLQLVGLNGRWCSRLQGLSCLLAQAVGVFCFLVMCDDTDWWCSAHSPPPLDRQFIA